jgi:hypothetical protein
MLSGGIVLHSDAGAQVLIMLRYGTGLGPANGAPLTGTPLGSSQIFTSSSSADASWSFCFPGVIYDSGSDVWIDLYVELVYGSDVEIDIGSLNLLSVSV